MRAAPLVVAVAALLAAVAGACSGPPGSGGRSDADIRDAGPIDGAAPDGAALMADLSVDSRRTMADLSVGIESYAADSCELDPDEQCVGAPGERRILRFTVETPNLGTADLFLGTANADNPHFVYSECHGHFHFRGYAAYRLLDEDGVEVLVGRKQAFCLVDFERYLEGDEVATTPRYSCEYQGLQAGWSDVYLADLPCQYLDVTNLADGAYTLEIEVNPDGELDDSDGTNNLVRIPVELGAPELETPTEDCSGELDAHALERLSRECGWTLAGEFDCTPGEMTGAGCAQSCGVGSCTGNPMIRVCDASDDNCSSGSALQDNDNRCGSSCPFANEFLCPESGRLAVYTAPRVPGEPYTCNVGIGSVPVGP